MTKPPIITNRKPADELAWIREQIADLKAREDYIRRKLIDGTFDVEGDEVWADIQTKTQKRFQRKLVEEELGDIERFFEPVDITIIRIRQKVSENA